MAITPANNIPECLHAVQMCTQEARYHSVLKRYYPLFSLSWALGTST